MAIKTFAELMEAAQEMGPKTVAIAAAHEQEILLAAADAESGASPIVYWSGIERPSKI